MALLVLLAGCSYVYLLLIAPFFRPAHVLRMLKADIPRVRRFGAEIAGTRGDVEFVDERSALERSEAATQRFARHASSASTEAEDDEPR
ncbi:MAG TPA: hypothetical protein VF006_02155 [Longimicrobium sp.]